MSWQDDEHDALLIDRAAAEVPPDEAVGEWARDKRAFISSVMEGLREERAAAADGVRLLGTQPVMFEEFGGRDIVASASSGPVRSGVVSQAILRGLTIVTRSGPGVAWASLMSIFAQDLDLGLRSGSVASCFWTVLPCVYGRTRIAGRNVTLPGHLCHLIQMGEDLQIPKTSR